MLDKYLQPYTADLQLHRKTSSYAGRPLVVESSAPPSWLFGYTEASAECAPDRASAQAAQLHSSCQDSVSLAKHEMPQHQDQQRLDEALHGPRSGTGSSAGPSKPAGAGKRSEAWKAKNRRAQQRFREKQKVTKDCMQQQLAKVTAQLHALETEHNQLTGSNAVLEKVLQSHQLQLEILHDQQQTTQKAAAAAVPESTKAGPGTHEESGKSSEWALMKQPGPQPQSADDHTAYAEMVTAMRGIAGQVERDGMSTELAAALKQQCSAVGFNKGSVLSDSNNLRNLYMVNLDPEMWDATDMMHCQPEHWQAVTNCLELTTEQKAGMIRLRTECLAKQGEIQIEWHQLCNAIAEATVRDPACAEQMRDLSLDVKRLQALTSTLQKGQTIWLDLYQQAFQKV
ncbi:hypothetical protein ABBQ32_001804 [Trebouxia sp. C0010 RCD-2024]